MSSSISIRTDGRTSQNDSSSVPGRPPSDSELWAAPRRSPCSPRPVLHAAASFRCCPAPAHARVGVGEGESRDDEAGVSTGNSSFFLFRKPIALPSAPSRAPASRARRCCPAPATAPTSWGLFGARTTVSGVDRADARMLLGISGVMMLAS